MLPSLLYGYGGAITLTDARAMTWREIRIYLGYLDRVAKAIKDSAG